jgi:hypothetical protein
MSRRPIAEGSTSTAFRQLYAWAGLVTVAPSITEKYDGV